jgi:hypothetical protein
MVDEALEFHKSSVQHRSWCVEWFGSQGDFIAGKAREPISLQRFAGLESLYAVGPLENARGEVSIYDSAALISEFHDGLVNVSIDLSRRAAFLVYAIVENWRRTTIRRSIAGEQQLGDQLLRFAVETGIDVDQPFPFLLQCHMAQAAFHILCNQSDGEYNPHLHRKGQSSIVDRRQGGRDRRRLLVPAPRHVHAARLRFPYARQNAR